jgi:ABC-type siderophore export system fused ATPase/permease subunit
VSVSPVSLTVFVSPVCVCVCVCVYVCMCVCVHVCVCVYCTVVTLLYDVSAQQRGRKRGRANRDKKKSAITV